MERSFSLRRLWLLLRADFLAGRRGQAWIAGLMTASLFLYSLVEGMYGYMSQSLHQKLFGYTLFIWGIPATSLAFRRLDDRGSREAYLLLPASALEKLLARLLPVTLGIAIALPVYILFLSVVLESFNQAVFGTSRPLFDPLDPDIWKLFGYYLILQSPFFLGAVWFGRASFFRTALALLVFHILLALLVLAAAWLAVNFDGVEFTLYGVADTIVVNLLNPDWDTRATILRVVLVLLPPVLWWIAWLRLRELQADGI